MPMPLEGIRVLDWTQWQQGPMAGVLLADMGADVIKIEHAVQGDAGRGLIKSAGMDTFVTGRNAYFEGCNRNKKGITLDLSKPEGRQILYQLVEKSDVFLHNFRDPSVVKLGLDYETLAKYNPRLIYAQATGWGEKGPDRDAPSFDYAGLARSGIMTCAGEPDMPPLNIAGGIGDQTGSVMLAFGIITALLARERLGIGQKVNTSMLGSLLWLQAINVNFKLIGGKELKRQKRSAMDQPLWNSYRCGDGRWLVLAHLQAQRYWPNVCKALGLEELENDPRFATTEKRRENNVELILILDKVFATRTQAEWLDILKVNDVIYTPVNTFDDLESDPQIVANDYITGYDHPAWGKVKVLGIPIHFSQTPGTIRMPAPEFGQHTEEVLAEVLGYSWDNIGQLRDKGII